MGKITHPDQPSHLQLFPVMFPHRFNAEADPDVHFTKAIPSWQVETAVQKKIKLEIKCRAVDEFFTIPIQ